MIEVLPPPIPSDAAIEALLAKRIDLNRLSRGMVVGITDNTGHRFVSQGFSDASNSRAVDADSLFEIGSITKLITALVLADMVTKHQAALDEPVQDLLPSGVQVPVRNGRAITLLDLATHRSGLPRNPANFGMAEQTDPEKPYTPDMLYAFLVGHELARTPGDGQVYSNLGYGLLGHAMSCRAGSDYEDLARSRVLAPLGMHRTCIAIPREFSAALVTGHDDALDPVPAWRFGAMEGAGAFRSSAADMLLFADAFRDPAQSPLHDAIAMLSKPFKEGGFGHGTDHPDAGTRLSHDGGTGGFRSYFGCLSEWNRGIIVLSNSMADVTSDLGVHILDPRHRLLWHRTAVQVAPAHLLRLLGRYRLTPTMIFDVTADERGLLIKLGEQKAYRVFPTSD